MIRLSISGVAEETGALLTRMLKDRKVYDPNGKNVVCYGMSARGDRTLNQNCGINKIERLKIMAKAGVSTVPWFKGGGEVPADIKFPLLARKANGYGGTDIVPVFQKEEVAWRIKAGWDWFSSYVPVRSEFRVWIFRGNHLDTYEKAMKRPGDYKFIGRNFRNGFDFSHVSHPLAATVTEAVYALDTLKLDFGAVDLLLGEDGKVYILEVNTAPGVIKSGAQDTLEKLADRIVAWDSGR